MFAALTRITRSMDADNHKRDCNIEEEGIYYCKLNFISLF